MSSYSLMITTSLCREMGSLTACYNYSALIGRLLFRGGLSWRVHSKNLIFFCVSLSQSCRCRPLSPTSLVSIRQSLFAAPGRSASSGPSVHSASPSSRWSSWCSHPGSAPPPPATRGWDRPRPVEPWDCLRWEGFLPLKTTSPALLCRVRLVHIASTHPLIGC